MEIREELNYVKSHEWVKEEGEVVTIGLTDYAQSELGDLVFVNLPEEGDEVSVGEAFGGDRKRHYPGRADRNLCGRRDWNDDLRDTLPIPGIPDRHGACAGR